ncbi:hypothetical protein DL764_000044 [Monosporascus ibericus]|uniref:Mannan endo-1,6-alpha-mannosidase n=1 Tax=Monosporascus ibericus TaxID=155417 RepID=A0A4Q4U0D6_9PEZI|nr:hypothetical protein DL764_000044 [Monosporascus ibericus]
MCPQLVSQVLAALEVDIEDSESIKAAARLVAEDLMSFYEGELPGRVPGILPGPPPDGDYFWWQGGALWGTMLDYWHWTEDDTYNDVVYRALLHQVGDNRDFMHPNWTASLGNDDQAFWALSSMIAAETGFQDPPDDEPQWLALTQAVWNEQASDERRDDTCGGGLRWQMSQHHTGYFYKNTITNGLFFNIGARLARYTDNATYARWSEETWDWLMGVGYIDDDWNVYDGGHVQHNCTDTNEQVYSYNAAILLLGAANMYNYTGNQVWRERIDPLLNQTLNRFFPDGIAYEPICEERQCSFDAVTFKGFIHRWLASAAQVAPFMRERVLRVLKTSAQAAANQCVGGDNGRMCGFHWRSGEFDNFVAAGNQMNVLAALSSVLAFDAPIPLTNSTGGTSRGDPSAGQETPPTIEWRTITTGDKVGAGMLTMAVIVGGLGTMGWMGWD